MQQQLRRDLGLSQAILTVVGIVIGSGIFALPALVFSHTGAPGLGILAWLLGGAITLMAGLSVSELVAAMPKAGGSYIFLKEAYGDWLGFLQGWSYLLTYNSALNASLAMLLTTYLTALVPLSAGAQTAIGLGLILALSIINIFGVRFGGLIQVVATLGKLVPIGLLILFGLPLVEGGDLLPLLPPAGGVGAALAGAVLPILWTYDGWMQVGLLAEEIRNPQRNLPLAFIGGLGLAALIYVLFNAALIGVVPMAAVVGSDKPVIPMATALFGHQGARLITLGMLVSMFGTLNALVMTAPRFYLAMARDGLFPAARAVASLHPRYGTPVASIVISALWSAVLLLTGSFDQLLSLAVFVSWLYNILSIGAVFVLRRKRPDLNRPYRCWGYPVVPAIGIAGGLWVLVSLFVTDGPTALAGVAMTLTGLPVYLYLRRRGASA